MPYINFSTSAKLNDKEKLLEENESIKQEKKALEMKIDIRELSLVHIYQKITLIPNFIF